MTSAQSLLYAAASDVTIERVRALVRQIGAESPTIEYKEQMCDTIARGVAALGNTYGGLLLVGGMGNPEQGRDGSRAGTDRASLAAVPALSGRGDPGVRLPHRGLARWGNTLYVADTGNARIMAWDLA